jgi:hypothetical protein
MNELENKEWLYNEYVMKKRSCEDIATELKTYRHKVRRALIKNDIELRSQSAAQLEALNSKRAIHPTKGTKRPADVKQSISESVSIRWSELTDEQLKERSQLCKERWNNMSSEEKDRLIKAGRQAVLKAAKEGSKLEKFLFSELTKAGYVIEYHKQGLVPGDKLQIDLFVPRLSTAIEIDGPSHFYPIWGDEQLQKTIQSDIKKMGLLLGIGLVVLRIRYTAKSLSQKTQRKALSVIIDELSMIERNFPNKTSRLIELEV